MMLYERPVETTVVLADSESVSPPGLSTATTSKSSKSSSFQSSRSYGSDRESVLTDVSHFEDIGLQDEVPHQDPDQRQAKRDPSPYASSYASELRAKKSMTSLPRGQQPPVQQLQHPTIRSLSKSRSLHVVQKEIYPARRRSNSPKIRPDQHDPHVRSTSTNQLLSGSISTLPLRNHHSPNLSLVPNSRPSVPSFSRRHRTPSPNLRPGLTINPRDPTRPLQLRRSNSWQSTRDRKTEAELEKECDEDDGDDIPEGFVLDNVPLSPRPPSERIKSQPPSKPSSPERKSKDRVRSVGNGTPANAAAHGSIRELRSPNARSDATFPSLKSPDSANGINPLKSRVTSWHAHMADLNRDAKELTEKLEEHAEELEERSQRSSTGSMPQPRRASDVEAKSKHKSALAELPPLRRSNIMIDPLPISKEKEAVLSRTRPSWLPPKDPAEERRHLREYQKMMAASLEAERRREEKKKAASKNKDTAADSLQQIWERDIVPRWSEAVRERRTRELWWRGVAPRSRGVVWARAIGNDLGLTERSFEAALGRAHAAEAREKAGHGGAEDHKCVAWMRAIRRDAEENTWKDLRIFQAGGPLNQSLLNVLSAYSMYRSDIGYVTGCNTIAALLLLNTPTPAAAFIALANVLNRALPLSFYCEDAGAKASAYNLLMQTLAAKSRRLHDHLAALPGGPQPDAYLGDAFTSLFTGQLALEEASRLWDVYVFEGDAVLVRAGVAVLLEQEMALLGARDLGEVRGVVAARRKKNKPSVGGDGGGPGGEERWMDVLREAGKNNS